MPLKLARDFGVSLPTARSALNGITRSGLAKHIRTGTLRKGGEIYLRPMMSTIPNVPREERKINRSDTVPAPAGFVLLQHKPPIQRHLQHAQARKADIDLR